MRQQIFKQNIQKICVAEFTPTPTFESMFLFFTKDIFVSQPNKPHLTTNTKVGVGVQFADALFANKNDDAITPPFYGKGRVICSLEA